MVTMCDCDYPDAPGWGWELGWGAGRRGREGGKVNFCSRWTLSLRMLLKQSSSQALGAVAGFPVDSTLIKTDSCKAPTVLHKAMVLHTCPFKWLFSCHITRRCWMALRDQRISLNWGDNMGLSPTTHLSMSLMGRAFFTEQPFRTVHHDVLRESPLSAFTKNKTIITP